LLSQVLEHHRTLTVCEARITSSMQYLKNGSVSPALGIELGAQAAAVHTSLAQSDAVPKVGHLVSCPSMHFFGGPLLEGSCLTISVAPTTSEESWRLFHVKIKEGETLRAEGDIAVHLPLEQPQKPTENLVP
jgi:predicted hotdog family 3-hydroxylacyl-ACP dehydratase